MSDNPQIHIFDRALVRGRRQRAAKRFAAHDTLHKDVAGQLIERLGDIKQDFQSVLDLGARDDSILRNFAAKKYPLRVAATSFENVETDSTNLRIVMDEELLPFATRSFDLVVSNLNLHSTNDLPGALVQIRRVLKPGGLFLGALLGGETLHELRRCLMDAELAVTGGISPRVSPAIDLPMATALIQRAGFQLPVTDSEIFSFVYPDAFALMRELRGMGEGNAQMNRLKRPSRRAVFMETARLYADRFSAPDGGILATFEVIFMHGVGPLPDTTS